MPPRAYVEQFWAKCNFVSAQFCATFALRPPHDRPATALYARSGTTAPRSLCARSRAAHDCPAEKRKSKWHLFRSSSAPHSPRNRPTTAPQPPRNRPAHPLQDRSRSPTAALRHRPKGACSAHAGPATARRLSPVRFWTAPTSAQRHAQGLTQNIENRSAGGGSRSLSPERQQVECRTRPCPTRLAVRRAATLRAGVGLWELVLVSLHVAA